MELTAILSGEEPRLRIYSLVRKGKGLVGMFNGYYRDPERTKEVWHDGINRGKGVQTVSGAHRRAARPRKEDHRTL
ncbi:hypothetical protein SAMN05444406_10480 [Caldicoprobacter faecalis]|uniref:Uncharacterized protein n=1 Tax=Caldicoprobacter faecalis TaxID=937334 RepID=A0A1I5TDR3_9FIRM|nr:hypothetical protein SAMN05444406_10480 [Caldicoprobacter faecalis]